MTPYEEHLLTIIGQCQLAMPWMIKSLIYTANELNEGNYSDEMKHAMATKELLDTVDVPKNLKQE